ncbi:MAG: DUF2064 domain-containing protein [Rhodobacterales bacterium]|nr:DUF2064 domain-containing protein [Rhodobacterales bacterium]
MAKATHGWVCIFAKPPVPGASKTRLGRTMGMQTSATLARAFLADTVHLARGTGVSVALATTHVDGDFGLKDQVARWDQGDGDLGARVERVLRRALASDDWVIALGADSPGLPPAYLALAIQRLSAGAPSVLGPSADGGFYLLGVRNCPKGLLANLPWSQPDTAAATANRLEQHGLKPELLPEWFDIDEEADLARFRQDVPREDAPITWAQLDGLEKDV